MIYIYKNITDLGGEIHPISPEILRDIPKFPSNTTVCESNGEAIFDIRMIHYMLYQTNKDSLYYHVCPYNGQVQSTNLIFNEQQTKISHIEVPAGPYRMFGGYYGLEDIRLVKWNDKIYANGAHADMFENRVIQSLYELNEKEDGYELINPRFFDSGRTEKNWSPISDQPFKFLYDPCHRQVLDISKQMKSPVGSTSKIEASFFEGPASGSTQTLRIGDNYLSLIHERDYNYNNYQYRPMQYYHRFMLYDSKFKTIVKTPRFHFLNSDVEFCCGLALINDMIYITISVNDSSVHLIKIPLDKLTYLIRHVNEWTTTEGWDDYFVEHFDELHGLDRMSFIPILIRKGIYREGMSTVLDQFIGLNPSIELYNYIVSNIIIRTNVTEAEKQLLLNKLRT